MSSLSKMSEAEHDEAEYSINISQLFKIKMLNRVAICPVLEYHVFLPAHPEPDNLVLLIRSSSTFNTLFNGV